MTVKVEAATDDTTRRFMERLLKANIGGIRGRCIPTLAEEAKIFGTSTLLVVRDDRNVVAALNSHPPIAMAEGLSRLHGQADAARRLQQETQLLEHLAVAPRYRRRGYGRALLQEAERRHRAVGVPVWFGFVDIEEAAAMPFYMACGFARATKAKLLPIPANVVSKAIVARRGDWIHKAL